MLNKEEAKLLNCPFCDGAGKLYINKESRFGDKYAVICEECGSRTPDLLTPEEAVELWNTRKYFKRGSRHSTRRGEECGE